MSLSVMLCPASHPPPPQPTLLPMPGSSITSYTWFQHHFLYLVPASQSNSVPSASLNYLFINSLSEFVVLNYGFVGLACVSGSLLCSVDFVSFYVPVCFFLVARNTHNYFILFLVKIIKPSFTSCDTFSGAVSLLCGVLYVCIFSRWNVFYFIIKFINCYLFNSWLSSEIISAQSHISFHSLLVVTQVLIWILDILDSHGDGV